MTRTTGRCTLWRYEVRRNVVFMMWKSWDWIFWVIALSPAWGAFLLHFWQHDFLPRLITLGEIKLEADRLIEQYGSRAEEIAFIEEDSAWRYSQTVQQGKWHRVRKELWRRYDAGEWKGPGD